MPDTFLPLSQGTADWRSIACDPTNGDVYVGVADGAVYKQTAGAGDFSLFSATVKGWYGLAVTANGVLLGCDYGNVFQYVAGIWQPIGYEYFAWSSVWTVGNDVYASVHWGDVYKQTNNTGPFVALSQPSRPWRCGCGTLSGKAYAGVPYSDIYEKAVGSTDFVGLGVGGSIYYCFGLAENPKNGDLYAADNNGDIWIRKGGIGSFTQTNQTSRLWGNMCGCPNGSIYAIVPGVDIFRQPAPLTEGGFCLIRLAAN